MRGTAVKSRLPRGRSARDEPIPAERGDGLSETDSFGELVAHLRRIETVDGISNTLDWDQQTMMPPKAAALRGEQQALLAGLSHAYISDPRIGDWLTALEGSEDPVRAATSRNLGRTYRREKRVPADLVDALARAKSEGFGAWVQAKKSSDWASFEPKLQHLVDLTRRRAEAIDAERHPYEVLLEEFDPGSTVATLRDTFGRLRDGLVPLLEAIAGAPQLPGIDRELSVERLRRRGALHRLLVARGAVHAAEALAGQGAGHRLVRVSADLELHRATAEADTVRGAATERERARAPPPEGHPDEDHVGDARHEHPRPHRRLQRHLDASGHGRSLRRRTRLRYRRGAGLPQ
ncbi:MAG TPA: hypothetical protein DEF51_20610 [Myxococcales bacterium]|nr:hypothetical protein [Myxococcales bacterium]